MSLFFAGVVPPTSYWGPVRPPDFPHESLRARRKVVEDPPGKVKKKKACQAARESGGGSGVVMGTTETRD